MNLSKEKALAALRRRLQEGDPAAEPASETEQASAADLRRRVLAAARPQEKRSMPVQPSWLPVPWLVPAGALVALVLVVAMVMARMRSPSPAPRSATVTPPEVASGAAPVRQVQFETRGGTRVIWVVAANLDL